jgi:activator of 2-hydroxyglutaryl-CoA dehydratase
MIARGASRRQIARGIHQSIATRSVSLLERVIVEETVLFAGGVALNPCMRMELEKYLGKRVYVPDEPQLVGALGCSRIAETL